MIKKTVRHILVNHLTETELKDLCRDVGFDYQTELHNNKNDIARSLISFLENRQRLNDATDWLVEHRPDVFLDEREPVTNSPTAVPHKTPVNKPQEAQAHSQTVTMDHVSSGRDINITQSSGSSFPATAIIFIVVAIIVLMVVLWLLFY